MSASEIGQRPENGAEYAPKLHLERHKMSSSRMSTDNGRVCGACQDLPYASMVTILIPTHNRPSYLARSLEFLYKTQTPHDIVIADSSEDSIFAKNNELILSYCNDINISHIDCRGMAFAEKCDNTFSLLNTPYVTLCGDDDFIVSSVITKCVEFLQENADYSHAHGRIITFIEKNSLIFPIASFAEYSQSANENEASSRLEKHFMEYTNNFYAVHRTARIRHNFSAAFQLDIGRGLRERLIAALEVIDGKRAMLDDLFMLRQKGHTGMDEEGRRTLSDNPDDEDYFQQISYGYNRYVDFLLTTIHKKSELSSDQVKKILDCMRKDYDRWREKKSIRTNEGLLAQKNNRISRFILGIYRPTRNSLNSLRVWSSLNTGDRRNLRLALASVREFYARKK